MNERGRAGLLVPDQRVHARRGGRLVDGLRSLPSDETHAVARRQRDHLRLHGPGPDAPEGLRASPDDDPVVGPGGEEGLLDLPIPAGPVDERGVSRDGVIRSRGPQGRTQDDLDPDRASDAVLIVAAPLVSNARRNDRKGTMGELPAVMCSWRVGNGAHQRGEGDVNRARRVREALPEPGHHPSMRLRAPDPPVEVRAARDRARAEARSRPLRPGRRAPGAGQDLDEQAHEVRARRWSPAQARGPPAGSPCVRRRAPNAARPRSSGSRRMEARTGSGPAPPDPSRSVERAPASAGRGT